MRRSAEILSISKNEIHIKYKKKKRLRYDIIYIIPIFLFSCMIVFGSVSVRSELMRISNPVSSLYNDNSRAVFAVAEAKNGSDYVLPIATSQIEIVGGDIQMTITNSIMINSPEYGVVKECGTALNGIKYIKILHTNDVMSIITNVDILGVKADDVVKRGQNIATGKVGDVVTLQLYNGDNQIVGLTLNQSKIVWEK